MAKERDLGTREQMLDASAAARAHGVPLTTFHRKILPTLPDASKDADGNWSVPESCIERLNSEREDARLRAHALKIAHGEFVKWWIADHTETFNALVAAAKELVAAVKAQPSHVVTPDLEKYVGVPAGTRIKEAPHGDPTICSYRDAMMAAAEAMRRVTAIKPAVDQLGEKTARQMRDADRKHPQSAAQRQ